MCNTPFCSCKMKRTSANSFVSRQPNDCFELAENSVGRSHTGVNNEHSPPLAEGGAESRQSRSRDGVLNRLRRTLSISRRSSQPLSAVVPFNSGSEEEVGENGHISVVQKTRAPHYRCVPLPPGFIPSEVLMSLDHEDQSSHTAESGNAVATIKFEKVGNQVQQRLLKMVWIVPRTFQVASTKLRKAYHDAFCIITESIQNFNIHFREF